MNGNQLNDDKDDDDHVTSTAEVSRSDFASLMQKRIKLLRKATGLPQSAVAAFLGESLNTYKKWEMSVGGNMPPHHFARFCELMSADLNAFMSIPKDFDPEQELTADDLLDMRPDLKERIKTQQKPFRSEASAERVVWQVFHMLPDPR